MAVMARESWTDGRIDDFRENVNQRFDQVDNRFDQVDKRFDQVDARFDRVEGDIRELRQTMIQGFFVLVGLMVTGFVGLAGLIVF
jgi:hypothetical protein